MDRGSLAAQVLSVGVPLDLLVTGESAHEWGSSSAARTLCVET